LQVEKILDRGRSSLASNGVVLDRAAWLEAAAAAERAGAPETAAAAVRVCARAEREARAGQRGASNPQPASDPPGSAGGGACELRPPDAAPDDALRALALEWADEAAAAEAQGRWATARAGLTVGVLWFPSDADGWRALASLERRAAEAQKTPEGSPAGPARTS
jgi:hypothetical protein